MFNVMCLKRFRMYNKLYEKFNYEINKIFWYFRKTWFIQHYFNHHSEMHLFGNHIYISFYLPLMRQSEYHIAYFNTHEKSELEVNLEYEFAAYFSFMYFFVEICFPGNFNDFFSIFILFENVQDTIFIFFPLKIKYIFP